MPYTGLPQSNASDAIRALVGDTDPTTGLLDDNTYLLIVATERNLYARASIAASALAGKYALDFNKRIGHFWRDAKVLYDHFSALAKLYRRTARSRIPAAPYAGGTIRADVEDAAQDSTMVQPTFNVGQIDDTEVAQMRDDEWWWQG